MYCMHHQDEELKVIRHMAQYGMTSEHAPVLSIMTREKDCVLEERIMLVLEQRSVLVLEWGMIVQEERIVLELEERIVLVLEGTIVLEPEEMMADMCTQSSQVL